MMKLYTFRFLLLFNCIAGVLFAEDQPIGIDRPPTSTFVGFVPGDAFYPISFGEYNSPSDFFAEHDQFQNFNKEDDGKTTIILNYDFPDVPLQYVEHNYHGYMKCEIRGYGQLQSMILAHLAIYAENHAKVRNGDRGLIRIGIPTESCLMLIVNKSFDFEKTHFYCRYNEDCQRRDTQKFPQLKYKPFGVAFIDTYQPHIWKPEAIIEDWKYAGRIPPLKVTLPEPTSLREFPNPTYPNDPELPILVTNFDDISFVAIPTLNQNQAYRKDIGTTFYVGNSDGVFQYQWGMNKKSKKSLRIEKFVDIDSIKKDLAELEM